MKLTMNDKKQNININVLPEKYRGTVIKFSHLIVILGSLCAVAIIILFYQIVLDATANTSLLRLDAEILRQRGDLRTVEKQEKNKMEFAIKELEEIGDKKDIIGTDMEVIMAAASAANVDVPSIQYLSNKIELQCPTDIYDNSSGNYTVMTNSFENFEAALVEYNRFISAGHESITSPPPEYIEVTILVDTKALPAP